MAPSTSSSIQVSVISRNERVNVINYSKTETVPSEKGNTSKSESSKVTVTSSKSDLTSSEELSAPVQASAESVRKSVVSNATQSKSLPHLKASSNPPPSPETDLIALDEIDGKEKGPLIACGECGAKMKSRRAMLAHLDRHLSVPVSCRACHRSFNSLSALKFHYEDFCISKTLVCPQCEEVCTDCLFH